MRCAWLSVFVHVRVSGSRVMIGRVRGGCHMWLVVGGWMGGGIGRWVLRWVPCIYPSIHPFIHPPDTQCPSIHPSIQASTHLSTRLSIDYPFITPPPIYRVIDPAQPPFSPSRLSVDFLFGPNHRPTTGRQLMATNGRYVFEHDPASGGI